MKKKNFDFFPMYDYPCTFLSLSLYLYPALDVLGPSYGLLSNKNRLEIEEENAEDSFASIADSSARPLAQLILTWTKLENNAIVDIFSS